MSQKTWIPEIMYEEGSEGSSSIPFIMVPENEVMPKLLYIFESCDTGETEPGLEGSPIPIVEWDLHQYADMAILKQNLATDVYDKVREALDLETLAKASAKGKKITSKIRGNVEEITS